MNGVELRNTATWAYSASEARARGLELCGLCGCATLPWTMRRVEGRDDLGAMCDDCAYWIERDAEVASRRRGGAA